MHGIMSSYEPFWTVVRGWAIFFVLVYHQFFYFFTNHQTAVALVGYSAFITDIPLYVAWMNYIPWNLGGFALGFFFFMAGYFVVMRSHTYASGLLFLWGRWKRLWPTYAVGVLASWGLLCIFTVKTISLGQLSSILFWYRPWVGYPLMDGALWMIEHLVVFFLWCGISWSSVTGDGRQFFWRTLGVHGVILALFYNNQNFYTPSFSLYYYALKTLIFIYVCQGGMLTALWRKQSISTYTYGLRLGVIVGVGGITGSIFYTLSYLGGLGTGLGLSLILSWGRFSGFQSFFYALGQRSYSIYVFHVIPGYLTTCYMWPYVGFFATIIGFCVALGSGCFFHTVVERHLVLPGWKRYSKVFMGK